MNEAEQTLANYILKQSLSNSDKVQNYLILMKAVKLRIEVQKLQSNSTN